MIQPEDLIEKIRLCDVEGVLAAIKQNPKVKSKDYFKGRSVIEAAMILDCLPLLKALLLDAGIKPTKDILSLRGTNYYYLTLRVSPNIALFVWSCDLQKRGISQFLFETYILLLDLDLRRKILAECLTTSSAHNRIEYIEWLVESGADVNYPDHNAPLIAAASVGANDGIQALLSYGSEINHKGSRGDDALWTAVINRHYDTVRLLMQKGAKPDNAKVKPLKEYPDMFPPGNAIDAAITLGDEKLLEILLSKNGT